MSNRDFEEESEVRFLRRALKEADKISKALDLPRQVRETATMMTRRLRSEDHLTGRGIEEVVAGALYLSCRMENVPRAPGEFAEYSDYSKKSILRTSKYLADVFDLEVAPSDPIPYAERIVSDLDLSDDSLEIARDLIEQGSSEGVLAGRSPTGIAAAAVYAAGQITGEKPNQSTLAELMDVTEVTIRNRYQELIEVHDDFEL